MAMKEVQYINNYPICDAEARKLLENKADADHEHDEYATEAYVQQIFNNVDINDFDMSDFATKEDVEDAVANIEIPEVDLSNYATKDYVTEQLANADPDVDLSNYALKSEIPTKVSQLENDALYISFYDIYVKDENGDYVVDKDGNYIIEDYVSKSEMESYVNETVAGVEGGTVDLSAYQTKNDSSLNTTDKTIVGAINELFQNANNGKQIIADAIGEPLDANDTFSAMGNKMDGLLDTFKTNMSNQGVPVESNDKFASLINKIPMIQGNGKIQYATGNLNIALAFNDPGGDAEDAHERTDSYDIDLDLDFEPSIIFVHINHEHTNEGNGANVQSMCISNLFETTIKGLSTGVLENSATYVKLSITDLTSKGFKLTRYFNPYFENYSYTAYGSENLLSYYAIGITNQEEDDLNNTRILTGPYRTMVLKNDGSVWSCGNYTQGMLGYEDHDYENVKAFVQATQPADNIKALIGGYDYSILFKTDGSFSGTGDNEWYQLGKTSDTYHNLTFTDISTIDDIAQMHTCNFSTFVIKNDGTLWGIGANTSGQLGLGPGFGNRSTWTQVTTNISDIKTLFCGYDYAFLLKNDGTLWATGNNTHGQLGFGDTTDVEIFTKVTPDISDIKTISCGRAHVFIMKNDGTLYAAGNNEYGQLGYGSEPNISYFIKLSIIDNAKKVSCGETHTAILKNDGTVWVCGGNSCGQLGLGNTTDQPEFVQVPINADDVIDVVCDGNCTFIIKSDGSVWSCGDNEYGQLGLNSDAMTILTFTETNVNINE